MDGKLLLLFLLSLVSFPSKGDLKMRRIAPSMTSGVASSSGPSPPTPSSIGPSLKVSSPEKTPSTPLPKHHSGQTILIDRQKKAMKTDEEVNAFKQKLQQVRMRKRGKNVQRGTRHQSGRLLPRQHQMDRYGIRPNTLQSSFRRKEQKPSSSLGAFGLPLHRMKRGSVFSDLSDQELLGLLTLLYGENDESGGSPSDDINYPRDDNDDEKIYLIPPQDTMIESPDLIVADNDVSSNIPVFNMEELQDRFSAPPLMSNTHSPFADDNRPKFDGDDNLVYPNSFPHETKVMPVSQLLHQIVNSLNQDRQKTDTENDIPPSRIGDSENENNNFFSDLDDSPIVLDMDEEETMKRILSRLGNGMFVD